MTLSAAFPRFRRRFDFGGVRVLFFQNEIEIARIDEYAECLAEDEDEVFPVERVAEQQQAPADREKPECDRDHALAFAFRGDPLHNKAHGEHRLRDKAKHDPPIEVELENVIEI